MTAQQVDQRAAAVSRTALVATDDAALVARILAGDLVAFELLMRRHNRRLFRLARATLRDAAEAEDALQDAYLHAYQHLDQFRQDAALSTWLSRLVLNECFARLRRHARRQNVVPISAAHDTSEIENVADQTEGPESTTMRAQMRRVIEHKVDELPADFRLVFVLRCVEELSVEEVAQCLDIPNATVRSRYFRARALLREALAGEAEIAERDMYEFGGWRCDRVVSSVLRRLALARGTV
jgi:RNA polymerase sigma factor (sigma-70 family)